MVGVLKQYRDAQKRLVLENKTAAHYSVYPVVDDGMGNFVPDTSQTPISSIVELVRIAHEQGSIPKDSVGVVGLSTSYSLYILLLHDTSMTTGTIFTAKGQSYRVGNIDSLRIRDGVYGKRAVLTVVGEAPILTPVIDGLSGGQESIVLAWSDMGVGISVEIQKMNGLEWETIATVAGVSYTDEGLEPDTQYEYRARSVYGSRSSAWSDSIFIATEAEDE